MKKSILFLLALFSVTMTTQAAYYYRGEKNKSGDNWLAGIELTESTDGYYAYYSATAGAHQFKICTEADNWSATSYNCNYVTKNFNNTDIADIGDYGGDNCYTWTSVTHYIIVYYPNTKINTSSNPIICASTFLPDDSETDLPEPEPVADVTVHFINTPNWAAVACHHWIPGGAGTSWPGEVLSITDEIAGYDVYTATFTGEHTSCIFNNNNNGSQTGDLTVNDGKYYEVNTNTWYDDKAAAEAALATPIPDETVYLINTGNWSTVMIYTWNGVGGTAWPGVEMTLTGETIEGYAVYSYTAKQGGQANLLFQESADVNKTDDLTWEAGKYYAPSKDKWYDTKEAAAEALATPVIDVYTVVGSSAELGLEWNPAKEANDMEKQDDGSYKKVYSNVELTSSVEWKIAKNDDWWNGPSFNNQNNTLPIAKSGIYNVTFVLSADLATATAEAELLEETNTVADCYISGNAALTGGAGWAGNEFQMEYTEATETYSYTFTGLAAATSYELKVILGGVWYGFAELVDPAPANVSEGTDNSIAFKMAAAGDVVVTYNVEAGITLSGDFAEPVTYDYYIAGTENLTSFNWSANGLGMEKDGDVYKHTFNNLAAGTYQFKITDGQFNTEEDKTHEHTALGAEYEEVSYVDGNIQIITEEAINLTVIFDATADKITFEGLTENEPETLVYYVEVPEGTEDCYIAGQMNEWAFEQMTQVDATHWTITYDNVLKTTEYKYACQASWDYVEKKEDGNDLDANRTWAESDVVEKWGKPVIVTYQLKGVGGWETEGIELVQNPDPEKASEYMLTCQAISATDAIKVVRLEDGVIKDYYGQGKVKDDVEVTVNYDGNGNITLPEGKYNFYFDTNEPEKQLGIEAATDCETEPEYFVVEEEITNFVFDTEAWPMVCMGGPSTTYEIEVYLTLTEDADGTLAYEDCSVSIMGTDATFIDGTLSNIDPFAPYADAVLHVQWDGGYYELQLAMSSTPAEPITIEAEDATVTLTEYPTNFEETEFAYELMMVAEWVNEAESLPYTVEFIIPTFDPTKASGEYNANFLVEGEGDAFGMNEGVLVTVTKDGNNVTLTGNVSALNSNAYNVTISGTLPTETPDYTRTVTPCDYGTICLPFGATSYTGMELYECVGRETGKVYLASVTTLEAGVPYIFQATATELAVYSDGTNASAGDHNGLHGTFDNEIEVAAGDYILFNNELRPSDGTAKVKDNRAYLVMSEIPSGAPQQMPGRRYIGMSVQGENETTGLDNITNGENTTIKLIENGQLIIIRGGEKFNAQGQKL